MKNSKEVDMYKDSMMINEVLKKYLNSEVFEVTSYQIRPASEHMLGFHGEHFKVYVEYRFNNKSHSNTFFYKTLPKDNEFKMDFNKRYRLFDREVYFHKHVFSQFKKFCDSRQCIPKCYYSNGDDLVFEDLHTKGFQMLKELRIPMDVHHARVVIRSLATFHAGSIIFEEIKSSEQNTVYRIGDDYGDDFDGGCFMQNNWYKKARRMALMLLASSSKYGKKTIYYQKAIDKWDDLSSKAINLLVNPAKEGRNVIVHMDLWNNNIMFKYDKNGNPIQCVLVDYQGSRLSKPAIDILGFIFLCLNKQTRDNIFDELVDLYYDELKEVLMESGIEIESIVSLKELRMSCEDYRLWGMVQSQVILQFLFMDEEDKMATATDSESFHRLMNVDRSCAIMKSFSHNLDYKERMMDILNEMVERYVI